MSKKPVLKHLNQKMFEQQAKKKPVKKKLYGSKNGSKTNNKLKA